MEDDYYGYSRSKLIQRTLKEAVGKLDFNLKSHLNSRELGLESFNKHLTLVWIKGPALLCEYGPKK